MLDSVTNIIAGSGGIPWSFEKRMSRLVKDSCFEVKKITHELQEGKDIIKLIARYTSPRDSGGLELTDINIIMDPSRYWCILAFSFRVSWGRAIGKVEYGAEDRGFPVPTRYIMTQFYDKGGQTVFETSFESWKYRQDEIPQEDFYLSAFGFPEPMGVPSLPPSRTWLWLLATTIAAAALAMLFAWLKRRRLMTIRASTSTAPPRRVS